MRTFLMSISQRDMKQIFAGVKRYEYTKQRALDAQRIIFYVKWPVNKVVGEARCVTVYRGAPRAVWDQTCHGAGMKRGEYMMKVGKAENVNAYELTQVLRYSSPRELTDYGVSQGPRAALDLGDIWTEEDSKQLRDDMAVVAAKYRNTFKLLADA